MADAAAAGVAAGIGDVAVTTGVEATVTTAACLPPVHAAAAGAADSDTGAVAAGGCVTGTGSAVGVAAVGAAVAGAAVDVANVGATRHGHEAGSKHRAEPFCAAHPPCLERGDGEAMSVAVLSVADSGTSNCSLRCRMKFAAAYCSWGRSGRRRSGRRRRRRCRKRRRGRSRGRSHKRRGGRRSWRGSGRDSGAVVASRLASYLGPSVAAPTLGQRNGTGRGSIHTIGRDRR